MAGRSHRSTALPPCIAAGASPVCVAAQLPAHTLRSMLVRLLETSVGPPQTTQPSTAPSVHIRRRPPCSSNDCVHIGFHRPYIRHRSLWAPWRNCDLAGTSFPVMIRKLSLWVISSNGNFPGQRSSRRGWRHYVGLTCPPSGWHSCPWRCGPDGGGCCHGTCGSLGGSGGSYLLKFLIATSCAPADGELTERIVAMSQAPACANQASHQSPSSCFDGLWNGPGGAPPPQRLETQL